MTNTDPYSANFVAPELDTPEAEPVSTPVSSPETSALVAGEPLADANTPAGSNAAAPAGEPVLEEAGKEVKEVKEGGTPSQEPATPETQKQTYEEALESARFWQSKHDKKVQEMEAQTEEARTFRPVIEAINANPDLMRIVADSMQNGSVQGAGTEASEAAVIEPPPPPEDPYSEEGESYPKKLYEWAKGLTESQQALVAAQKESQEEVKQAQQHALLRNEALSEAMHRFHLPQDKAGQLVNDLALDGGAIVRLFGSVEAYIEHKFAAKTPTAEEIRQREAVESARKQQEQREPPLATGAGGLTQPSTTTQFSGMRERASNPYE